MESTSQDKLENQLIDLCQKYLNERELARVKRAIEFSKKSHAGALRKSGESFVSHPLHAAIRLAKLKLDTNSIIAALLHDTLEDTDVSPRIIKREFGGDVLKLVEAVTKLSNIRIKKSWFPLGKTTVSKIPEFERQVETLRKMLVAVAKDIRVILIKLADKIHNLETLNFLPTEKRERIAREVIEIYAPVAGRLGMGEWKEKLEDLAFPYVFPKEYDDLKKLAIPRLKDRENYLKRIVSKVEKLLETNKIKAEINFRAKHWYSLYRKLLKYDNDLDKIYDLIAVRIIVDSIEDCYNTLGLIHSRWRPLVGRIKDYIALPKPNGYQSIHTTVFCEEGKIVEFQIRTKQMHQQAEFGVAAHWIYSEKKNSRIPNKNETKWLNDFSKIQKAVTSPEDFIKFLKLDLFQDRIFVFTPQGDVKDLPAGATPLDFAYHVHTDIGNHCAGAKVNGKIAPFDTKLQNGDIVEIIKGKNVKPKADWLSIVKTEVARSNIKKAIKSNL